MTHVRLFDKLLAVTIPKGIKRMMVLVAVFLQLERQRGEENPRLEDLNEQMHLVDDVAILDRMADLVGVLFKNDSLDLPLCCESGILENCTALTRSLPHWLKYDDRTVIIQDIAELTVCNVGAHN